MFFPFISRARFDDMLRERNYQIADRDRRIAQLEAERRMLWDKVCLLGLGVPVFEAGKAPDGSSHSELSNKPSEHSQESLSTSQTQPRPRVAVPLSSPRAEVLGSRRPSLIMRRMDRLAEARWLRKVYPAKAAELQRDEVMNQLDAAHREAVGKAVNSK